MIFSNEGRSLRVRQAVPEDAPILLRAYQDESFTRLYHSNNTPLTQEQLENRLTDHDPTEFGYVEFLIEHKQHGAIGIAALGDYSSLHKRAEYLIGLFKEKHRSRWHGTEATLLVFDLAFNIYHLHKIYTYVYDYNKLSQKNTLKFGFKQEGILEEHHYLLQEKRFINLYVNGMTEARFRNNEKIRRYSLRLLGRDVTQAYEEIKLSSDNQLPNEAGKKFLEGWLLTCEA
ncbi:MAG: GNAT family protein [Pseudomonadota bacterium]